MVYTVDWVGIDGVERKDDNPIDMGWGGPYQYAEFLHNRGVEHIVIKFRGLEVDRYVQGYYSRHLPMLQAAEKLG